MIGAGLAGTILSYQLHQNLPHASILLVDEKEDNISSHIAAGIFNPITGKMMSLTWQAQALFDSLDSFYIDVEHQLKTKFYHILPAYRVFKSAGEQNDWAIKSENRAISEFLGEESITYLPDINNPLGALHIKNAGWVNVPTLINAVQLFLTTRIDVVKNTAHFNPDYRTVTIDGVQVQSGKTIWCNGYKAAAHPLTKDLPWKPVRGELLEVSDIDLPQNCILNKGCFTLPYTNKTWLVGATYDHNLSKTTTSKAAHLLLDQLSSITEKTPNILQHRWGIRPATRDRRPIMGELNQNHFIFNGFGSKGVSLIPYFSTLMIETLINNAVLPKEVDVSRFY